MKIYDQFYDAELSRAMAESYQNGSKNDKALLEELLHQLVPLIAMVARTEIDKEKLDENIDVLRLEALERVYKLLERGKIATDNASCFTSYLYTTIRRSFYWSIRDHKVQEFDMDYLCRDPVNGRQKTLADVEMKIYIRQIKDLALSLIYHDIRYSGKEKEACYFMAKCILGYEKHNPMMAQFRFGLLERTTKQLLRYTRILVKSTIYAVREFDGDLGFEWFQS